MRQVIESLVSGSDVTDVVVSAHTGLWCDRGAGLEQVSCPDLSEDDVRDLAIDLIALGDRHIDPVHPYADVSIPGGIRVHAVLPPISPIGTILSLRISRAAHLDYEALTHNGFMSLAQANYLANAVRERKNFLITGGAGVGKTTLLAALMSEVTHTERIVTIEDVTELVIDHPHVVSLQTRQANIEGAGAITIGDLIPQVLRMRADRIIIGESRGSEWGGLLSALNTGHSGGGTTVHANSLADVPARVMTLGFLSGLSEHLCQQMVLGAFDCVVHIERGPYGRRIAAMGTFVSTGTGLGISPIIVDP
jgi:pilus assembly protein CpaF